MREVFCIVNGMSEHLHVVEKTQKLVQALADYSAVSKIGKVKNAGKKIQMCVSTTLILDALSAFEEYCKLVKQPDYLKKHKVALSLLSRYIFESYVTFLYIYISKKKQTQQRAKAFYHYGEYKKGKMQKRDDLSAEEKEWSKYIPPKSKKGQWHGKTFQDLSDEAKYSPIVYQAMSQFTHPGIFTLERVLNTEMFNGMMLDSEIMTSSAVCDIMAHAHNLKLYGLKQKPSNEKEINALVKIHNEVLNSLSEKRRKANQPNS